MDHTTGPENMEDHGMDIRFGSPGAAARPEAAALEEVLQHVETLQRQLDQVTAQLNELQDQDQHLRQGIRELTEQIDRARRLQLDLLPRCLPDSPGLKISKLFLPATELSGDMYDILRLNDEQLAIQITDASGHGMAAAMLSIFLKQSLRTWNGHSREASAAVPPDQLLRKLNREILEIQLTECDFITSIHAVYDERERQVRWARGGMPYPILIRRNQPPQQVVSEGGLVGAFSEQTYDLVNTPLDEDDILLFYTDGLEALLLNRPENREAPTLLQTAWVQSLAPANIAQHFARIEKMAGQSDAEPWPTDDITLLALQGTARTPQQ